MGTWKEALPFNGINPTAAENMPCYDAWASNQTSSMLSMMRRGARDARPPRERNRTPH